MVKNLFIIARKEFRDLLNNRFVIFALVLNLLLVIISVYRLYNNVYHGNFVWSNDRNSFISGMVSMGTISAYGSFIGIVIGYSTIASEVQTNALGVLAVKPVYRDTIINGKMIGATLFLLCMVGLTSAIYVSLVVAIFGNILASAPLDFYVTRLLISFMISLFYILVFYTIAILVTLAIKDHTVALIISVITIVISSLICSLSVSGNIGIIAEKTMNIDYEEVGQFVAGLSPDGIISEIGFTNVFDPSANLQSSLQSVWPLIFRLVIYIIIALVLSYIAFIRRDIR
jgi:ABC-2 type transport system permease protein